MTVLHKRAALAAALGLSFPAAAVHLGVDGLGQALIYPYYTVRSAGGNAFNTYLSVVNTTSDGKAVRVRLREGRAARAVLDFNLYLSPNDVWAAAVVPTEVGTQIITNDTSCTDPAFAPGTGSQTALALHANAFTGANSDGFGDTLDRTREGYLELIEMATLSGASAVAITHNSAGVPANCAAIRATATMITGAPSGGLSGTLTLINVNSGLDFTFDATALDALSTRAFFRPPGDPYPDWTALEIDPVSMVLANGYAHRSLWTRPQDAVSAVLMRADWAGEYVLDNGTRSLTDVVVTLPTRRLYLTASTFAAPFTATNAWTPSCSAGSEPTPPVRLGEELRITAFNREEQGAVSADTCSLNCRRTAICAASAVASVRNAAAHQPADTSRTGVLGSTTFGLGLAAIPIFGSQNGWIQLQRVSNALLTSLPGSTRTSILTGEVATSVHSYSGLPVVGFSVRTFINGTLSCDAGSCQGSYGGAFPLRYITALQP